MERTFAHVVLDRDKADSLVLLQNTVLARIEIVLHATSERKETKRSRTTWQGSKSEKKKGESKRP